VIETKAEIGFVKNEIRTSIILFNINLRFCDNFSTIADLIQQKQVKTSRRFLSYWGTPLSLSDIRGSGGAPPEGEQEGESPAFRAGKGQAFLTREPREGHRESIGAKGQWCSLVKDINHCRGNMFRKSLAENSGNSGRL
jgi:hypothetical protein